MTPTAISERQLDKVEQKLQETFCRARQASLVTYKVCYLAPSSQGDRLLQSMQKIKDFQDFDGIMSTFVDILSKKCPED